MTEADDRRAEEAARRAEEAARQAERAAQQAEEAKKFSQRDVIRGQDGPGGEIEE